MGDSIVEKVFDGLSASDTLVVVLSPASVTSRWVKEELDASVMRRLSEGNIRILPVLLEDCELPIALRHISYADFSAGQSEGLHRLLDSLSPGHAMWQSLSHLYDHFGFVCDDMLRSDLTEDVTDFVVKLHSLLDSALGLRVEIEFRRTRQELHDMDFFEKIGALVGKGVDVRSPAWNSFVSFRSAMAHDMPKHHGSIDRFARLFARGEDTIVKNTYNPLGTGPVEINVRDYLGAGLDELKGVMRTICFDQQHQEQHITNA